jgi:hypothetical protein
MPSGQVSVPSSSGPVSFTVTGTNTLAYAQSFALALNTALSQGKLGYSNLSHSSDTIPGHPSATTPTVVEEEINAGGTYTLTGDSVTGGVYAFVDSPTRTGIAVTVTGSGTNDSLLSEGEGGSPRYAGSTTYNDVGGNNDIIFVNGNNTYNGDMTSSAGTDHILAGSGDDTIYTGAGPTTVNSGTGSATIYMQDTVTTAGAVSDPNSINPADYNQFTYLDDGTNTVYMNGVADVVVATAPGQLIYGGPGIDLVALVPPVGDNIIGIASDTVTGGSGLTSVYDASNGNLIEGSTGTLVVTFGTGIDASVVSGTGTTLVYGTTGDTITYTTDTTSGTSIFIGNAGESVDASGSAGSLTMVLGTGNETLTGGTGPTTFNANYDTVMGTGSITINDFAGSDVFNFVGYTEAEYQAALATGTSTTAGYQITLSDNTVVTFTNLNSIAGHTTNT